MLRKAASVVALLTLAVGCGSAPTSSGDSSAAAVTTTSAAATSGSGAPQPSAPVAEQLKFTAKTVDGADFAGESLAGKPAVLWFWAPWCPKCQREAPGVAATAEAHGAVTFLGVAALDEVPAMKQFVDRFKLGGFAHIADTDTAVWKRFGVTAQPAYAFIGRDGEVEVVTTQLTEERLAERVAALAGS